MLPFAPTLRLPADEAVTQKYGFIGRSGSGKSYAAMRLAELFLQHEAQVIAIDWVGIWWSLRLAHNGRDVGFKHVYIFGGEHADVPLDPASGALMADLVVDKHISVILDVMHFRKAERTRFATAFAEQFFHRKKTARTACHLFIEEAQAYLPQMVRGEEARMVGVFEDIGKVGRNYGIGTSLISQRPQAINKDVLNQVEVLLAFQTNGPQERKAIAGWTAENTDAGAAMMQELPKLRVGDALAWSPQWLRVANRVHVSERITYDASSTPTQKAKGIKPKTLDKADLEQLGAQMSATIEKAKADDPKELRKQIAELQKVLKAQVVPTATFERVEVPVALDKDLNRAETIVARAEALILAFAEADRKRVDMISQKMLALVMDVRATKDAIAAAVSQVRPPTPDVVAPGRPRPSHPLKAPRPTRPHQPSSASAELGKCERAILRVLAQVDDGCTAGKLTLLSGYRYSGGFKNSLSTLRHAGYMDGANTSEMRITDAGRVAAGDVEPLPSGRDLADYWLTHASFGKCERAILGALLAHPAGMDAESVCRATDYEYSGGFKNALANLRTAGVVVGRNTEIMRAHEDLL